MLIPVERQPEIPPGVKDIVSQSEWHRFGGYWVVSLHSGGDGVRLWAENHRSHRMPEHLIQSAKPDAIEYYREICPVAKQADTVILVKGEDNRWYWDVRRAT